MYPCTIVCIYAYACRHAFDQGGRAALSRRPRIHPVGEYFFKENSQRDFCSRVAKGTNDGAVNKEGTPTFGSISPNLYMKRHDQFVQGRDRGG